MGGGAHNPKDPRIVAAIKLLARTGAESFQLRYHDDEEPMLWLAYAKWPHGEEATGATTPLLAVMRLAEQVIDGGRCAHCGKPSGLTDDWAATLPLPEHICWWQFDPELKTFRRACEGETEGRALGMDPRTGTTVGRNDPCPCGSGEKWKRCHGR